MNEWNVRARTQKGELYRRTRRDRRRDLEETDRKCEDDMILFITSTKSSIFSFLTSILPNSLFSPISIAFSLSSVPSFFFRDRKQGKC